MRPLLVNNSQISNSAMRAPCVISLYISLHCYFSNEIPVYIYRTIGIHHCSQLNIILSKMYYILHIYVGGNTQEMYMYVICIPAVLTSYTENINTLREPHFSSFTTCSTNFKSKSTHHYRTRPRTFIFLSHEDLTNIYCIRVK